MLLLAKVRLSVELLHQLQPRRQQQRLGNNQALGYALVLSSPSAVLQVLVHPFVEVTTVVGAVDSDGYTLAPIVFELRALCVSVRPTFVRLAVRTLQLLDVDIAVAAVLEAVILAYHPMKADVVAVAALLPPPPEALSFDRWQTDSMADCLLDCRHIASMDRSYVQPLLGLIPFPLNISPYLFSPIENKKRMTQNQK